MEVINEEPNTNLFSLQYIMVGLSDERAKDYCGNYLHAQILEMKDDYFRWAVDLEEWKRFGKLVFDCLKSGRIDVGELKGKSLECGEKVFLLCDAILKADVSGKTDEELLGLVNELYELNVEITHYGIFPVAADYHSFWLSTALSRILEKRVPQGRKSQEYLSLLVSTTDETPARKASVELLALAAEANKKAGGSKEALKKVFQEPEFAEKVRNYLKEFCWIEYGYNGPAATTEEVFKEISDSFDVGVENELAKARDYLAGLRKTQAEAEMEFGLNGEEKRLFGIARDLNFMKVYRMDVRQKSNYAFHKIFAEAEKRFDIAFKDLTYCTIDEIRGLFETGELRLRKEISERKHYCVYLLGEKSAWTGEKARFEFDKRVKEAEVGEKSEVHGQVASVGKARGCARIVFKLEDAAKVKEGDVMVSPMTIPDLVPAMKRASAIVTDSGGITCHAAIIARELNKPCVIGTRKATKVFKDGDLVEVDATTGVVRKISS